MLEEAGFGEVQALLELTKGVKPTDEMRKRYMSRWYGDASDYLFEYKKTVKLKKIPYA